MNKSAAIANYEKASEINSTFLLHPFGIQTQLLSSTSKYYDSDQTNCMLCAKSDSFVFDKNKWFER